MILTLLLWGVTGAFAFIPSGKDNFLQGVLLRELATRMGKDSDMSYFELGAGAGPMGSRSLEEEQYYPLDYELNEAAMHPSLRDQEYLQHSSLWGSQLMSGGAGEGTQRLKPEGSLKNRQEIKTDATLPAYCNPPNPCPYGYSAEEGCLEEFENTASFSRRYQAAQDCMCDTEHMFECPNPSESYSDDPIPMETFNDLDFNQFIQHQLQNNPGLHHKNLVAKKFHSYNKKSNKKSDQTNPFLVGERLPVAAKKGNLVQF